MSKTPECNCGVSMGLRSDHESQCAGAYLQRPKSMLPKEKRQRVPLSDCEPRRLYKIGCRNLVLGVFDGKTGFIGIREKFGHEYLFTEYHWDTGPPFGTVHSVEDVGVDLPANIELAESLGTLDSVTLRQVVFNEGRGWSYKDTDEVSTAIKPCSYENEPLFKWLMGKEHEILPDHRRQMDEWRERMKRQAIEDDAE